MDFYSANGKIGDGNNVNHVLKLKKNITDLYSKQVVEPFWICLPPRFTAKRKIKEDWKKEFRKKIKLQKETKKIFWASMKRLYHPQLSDEVRRNIHSINCKTKKKIGMVMNVTKRTVGISYDKSLFDMQELVLNPPPDLKNDERIRAVNRMTLVQFP